MKRLLAIILLVASMLAGPASAQDAAKGFVEGLLESVLAAEGRSLSIEGVGISLTGDLTVAKVTVRDGNDAWLEIEQLSLVWRPLSLFSKQLDITSLAAGRVHVKRMPQSPEGKVAAPPELTDLRAAVIRQLDISRLQIDQPVLGQDVEMKLAGSAEITASPIEIRADMTASRLDGRRGDLNARVVLDPQTRQITLDAGFSEDADGVIANLLALRGDPSVDARLSAAGTFADWSGRFSLALNQKESFAGSATAASDSLGQTITLTGGGELAPLLPQWLERPFAGVSTLSARVLIPKGAGAADIDHVSLDGAAYGFRMAGVADWTGTRNNLTAELIAKDPASTFELPRSALLGNGTVAGLQLRAQVEGAYASPAWRASVAWASLAADRLGLERMEATLQGQGIGPVTFNGDLAADVVQGRSGTLPPASLGPLKGSITGTLRDGGTLDIAQTALTVGAVALGGSGTIETATGSFDLRIQGKADSPQTGIAAVDRLLAGPVTAEGRITGGSGDGIGLDGLTLTSAALTASASGHASAAAADLALAVRLPDLALVHEGLGGTALIDAGLKGPWQSLTARIDGRGEAVTLMGKSLERPVAAAEVKIENAAPSGTFTASGRLDGKPVDIAASFATDAAGDVVLENLSAIAGSARLSGKLRWPKGDAPTGTLSFSAPDLAEVAPLFLTELAGAATGDIEMRGAGEAHATEIRFNGRNIVTPSFTAATAEGNINIATLFGVPRPEGQVKLAKARIGGQRFDSAAVTAKATGSNTYRTAVKLAGPDLSLDADAVVTLGSGEARYAVSRLAGKLRGIPFSASAPLVLQQAGETVTLEPARLAIGKGSIRVGGRLLPDLKATVTVQSLPLAAFAGLGGQPGLQGTLSGEAVLTGSLSAPEGSFKLSGAGLSTEALKQLGVRPMSASANGTISGGTLTAALKADAGKQLSVTGNGTVDLRTSRIDMALKGRTGPALFADRLARSGVRAQGDVGFDLRLSGALDRPDINGQITLRKGVLGDAAGRFTLRDAAGSAEVSNRVVRITSLSGVTGRNGRATVTGTIALDAGLTASLDARVENGMYTDGSFVTARYDARLKITGPLLRAPLATGEIDLRGTKITLSELPKRALTPDDVKHINASRAVALQAREIRRNRPTGSSNLRVDIRLRALDAVSVSGRGLNVILNGGLRIYGPLDNLAADGSFQMVRGRLTLPARSLDFERGSLTFDRDLDPKIDFVAVSRRKDATITLTVSGYASEPSIQVTSVPQMPQEEAMARLIFDNSMLELSPLQIAQIASYVATLSGGGDSGLLSGLQNALGLDQLSITENESGGTDVGIAKRLNDKLSIGVEQTTQSNTTRVIIDLSATPELKVRGSIDSEGSSRIGVYYEKDY